VAGGADQAAGAGGAGKAGGAGGAGKAGGASTGAEAGEAVEAASVGGTAGAGDVGEAAQVPDGAAEDSDGDELRRRFREALEQKRSDAGVGSGSPGGGRKSAIRSSNARTQRLFRRKSG
jgi:hypothetical protein